LPIGIQAALPERHDGIEGTPSRALHYLSNSHGRGQAKNSPQHIIHVVGDSPRQDTKAFHFLGLEQLFMESEVFLVLKGKFLVGKLQLGCPFSLLLVLKDKLLVGKLQLGCPFSLFLVLKGKFLVGKLQFGRLRLRLTQLIVLFIQFLALHFKFQPVHLQLMDQPQVVRTRSGPAALSRRLQLVFGPAPQLCSVLMGAHHASTSTRIQIYETGCVGTLG
jgi:hypothetical protein